MAKIESIRGNDSKKPNIALYHTVIQPYIRRILALATPIELYSFCNKTRPPVLHIGAHLGEEADRYLELGFEEVNWVEAQHEIFLKLIRNTNSNNCLEAAIWSERTTLEFNVSSNSVSSSILEFGSNTPWKNLFTVTKVSVQAITLEDAVKIFQGRNLLKNEFILLLDIQGAELEALNSLKNVKTNIKAISCEVSKKPTYQKGASRRNIYIHLLRNHFVPLSGFLDGSTGHGDQLFVRVNHLFFNPRLIFVVFFRGLLLQVIRLKNKR